MVVEACRNEVELETRGKEQEELLQLPLEQQQLQTPAAPPPVWKPQLVIPLLVLRLGARALHSSSRRSSSSSLRRRYEA